MRHEDPEPVDVRAFQLRNSFADSCNKIATQIRLLIMAHSEFRDDPEWPDLANFYFEIIDDKMIELQAASAEEARKQNEEWQERQRKAAG